ncbi:hypothetical protein ACFQ51_54430 [Streptomyces kaempferi]
MNVASAYYAKVFATGSVDAGLVTWSPQTQRQPIQRQITYTNTTNTPVTLDLSVDPGGSPAQAFTLATNHVTVPANGTAQADLAADPRGLAAGLYSAQVTARFDGGQMHTAAGFSVESEKYALTVHLKDRAVRPWRGPSTSGTLTGATCSWTSPQTERPPGGWPPAPTCSTPSPTSKACTAPTPWDTRC